MRLERVTPYLRLVNGASSGCHVLYVHEGRLWYEDGGEVPEAEIPEWFWDSIRKVSPQGLAKVKYAIPEGAPGSPPPPDVPMRGRRR